MSPLLRTRARLALPLLAVAVGGFFFTIGRPAPRHVVLDYDDFGPQAMAFQLLGLVSEGICGGSDPGDCPRGNVQVVVHRDMADAEVARWSAKADHRVVEAGAALAFLDREIAELGELCSDGSESSEDAIFAHLRRRLERTRARLASLR